MLGWLVSLQVMDAVLVMEPLKLMVFTCNGILPVLPGSTFLSHSPAVVQPQWGLTLMISSVASPTLVKTKSALATTPALTRPKSWVVSENWIFGVPVWAGVALVAGAAFVAAAGACERAVDEKPTSNALLNVIRIVE